MEDRSSPRMLKGIKTIEDNITDIEAQRRNHTKARIKAERRLMKNLSL